VPRPEGTGVVNAMIKACFHDGIRLLPSCHNDRADDVACTSSTVSLGTSPLPRRQSQNAPRPRSWRGLTPWVARHGGVLCNVDTTSWPAGCVSHAESSQGIAQDGLAGPARPRQALLGTTPAATSRSSLRTRPFRPLRKPSASFPVHLHHMRRTPPRGGVSVELATCPLLHRFQWIHEAQQLH
jgi:hypothetical protein